MAIALTGRCSRGELGGRATVASSHPELQHGELTGGPTGGHRATTSASVGLFTGPGNAASSSGSNSIP